jgi:hypothetical protein
MTSRRTHRSTPVEQLEAFEPSGAPQPFPPAQHPSRPGRIRRAIARAAAVSRAAHRASVHF